jgi:hypothetical protein
LGRGSKSRYWYIYLVGYTLGINPSLLHLQSQKWHVLLLRIPLREEWVKKQWTCLPNKQNSPIILVQFCWLF